MSEYGFGPLEDFSRFDHLYEEDMDAKAQHRRDCPRHRDYYNPARISTFCICKELDRADKEAYLEDKADEARKYG